MSEGVMSVKRVELGESSAFEYRYLTVFLRGSCHKRIGMWSSISVNQNCQSGMLARDIRPRQLVTRNCVCERLPIDMWPQEHSPWQQLLASNRKSLDTEMQFPEIESSVPSPELKGSFLNLIS